MGRVTISIICSFYPLPNKVKVGGIGVSPSVHLSIRYSFQEHIYFPNHQASYEHIKQIPFIYGPYHFVHVKKLHCDVEEMQKEANLNPPISHCRAIHLHPPFNGVLEVWLMRALHTF